MVSGTTTERPGPLLQDDPITPRTRLLGRVVSGVGRRSPGGTASGIRGTAPTTGSLLPGWRAAVVFAGYGPAFAAAAAA